jgi:hypothetical protein
MALLQKTLSGQLNTGYTIVLSQTAGYSSVTIRSTAVVHVKTIPVESAFSQRAVPTAADAIPGAGLTTDFYKVAANEVVTLGVELPRGGDSGLDTYTDKIQQVLVWSTANCDVVFDCH